MDLPDMWLLGLTPEMVVRAKEELGETSDVKKNGLIKLRKLIEDEEGFEPLATDSFLLRFLRCKKYDVKRAHKTLKNYYAYKSRYSGLLTDFAPSDLKAELDTHGMFISPKRCPEGAGILLLFLGQCEVEIYTPERLVATAILGGEIGMQTEGSQVCGSQILIDLKGMTFNRMKYYSSPVLLSRIFRGLQDCWPYRINAIHVTNEPPFYTYVYTVVKTMLSKKLRDRVHFHGDNMETLHKFITPEALPKALGGTLGEKDFMNCVNLIHENEHIMQKINRYKFQGKKSPKYNSGGVGDDHTLKVPKMMYSK